LQETALFRNGVKMTRPKELPNDLIDSLLSNYKNIEDLIGESGLLKQLTKALVKRALQTGISVHFKYHKASISNKMYYSHLAVNQEKLILECFKLIRHSWIATCKFFDGHILRLIIREP